MVLWEKLWYYGKNYGTIHKTMELCFTMEKNYGTIVNYSKLVFLLGGCSVSSRWGMLKNPCCSKVTSAEYWSKFAALHRQWWRLHMSENYRVGRKTQKQTKKYKVSPCSCLSAGEKNENNKQKCRQSKVQTAENKRSEVLIWAFISNKIKKSWIGIGWVFY